MNSIQLVCDTVISLQAYYFHFNDNFNFLYLLLLITESIDFMYCVCACVRACRIFSNINNICCIFCLERAYIVLLFYLDNYVVIGASWIEKSYVNVGRYGERKNKMGGSLK